MFGMENMFGDMQAKQEALQVKLAEMTVSAEVADGKIKVSANCLRELTNISIDPEWLKSVDHEELEDLLLSALNRVLEEAQSTEAAEGEALMKDMLPPGLDSLFK
jgi:nucleoid-associated protein EbfC